MLTKRNDKLRVLYSFPHKIGAERICTTAWHQVDSLSRAGADVLAFPGAVHKPVSAIVKVCPTLARGKFRIPYKLLGSMRAFAIHDAVVAHRLKRLAGQIDIVHTWPLGSLQTLRTAAKLGIPTVLERPNAHTRFAYKVVQMECERVGIALPSDHEHAYKQDVLLKEEQEYAAADRLLCPSEFVLKTFIGEGFDRRALALHQYGYDPATYYPGVCRRPQGGLTMLFVGGGAPRKGLHYALEAWLRSPAHYFGKFMIAGAFVPGYAERLSKMLADPSVCVLGHRSDIPELMRQADVLILPSVEEGSALVTSEARGSGCVLLVSDAAGAYCTHMENALVHGVGDVDSLTQHITMLHEDRALLEKLRSASLRTVQQITWEAAGVKLLSVYRETIAMKQEGVSGKPHRYREADNEY